MGKLFWGHDDDERKDRRTPLREDEAYPKQAQALFDSKDLRESFEVFKLKNEYSRRNGRTPDDSAEALFNFLYRQKKPETKDGK